VDVRDKNMLRSRWKIRVELSKGMTIEDAEKRGERAAVPGGHFYIISLTALASDKYRKSKHKLHSNITRSFTGISTVLNTGSSLLSTYLMCSS